MPAMVVDGAVLEAIVADSTELWHKMDTVANNDPTEKKLAASATATLVRADELSDKLANLFEAGDNVGGRPRWADLIRLQMVRQTLVDVSARVDEIERADIDLAIELIDVAAALPDDYDREVT
jgi:hypothetical protein